MLHLSFSLPHGERLLSIIGVSQSAEAPRFGVTLELDFKFCSGNGCILHGPFLPSACSFALVLTSLSLPQETESYASLSPALTFLNSIPQLREWLRIGSTDHGAGRWENVQTRRADCG